MAHVLVVHDSKTIRSELSQALKAEGFNTSEAETADDAVREIWDGSFDAVLFSNKLARISGARFDEHLRALAPEVFTLEISRDRPSRIARKLADILDGAAAA